MNAPNEMPDRFWAFEDCPGSGAIPRSGVWIEEQTECPFASPQYIRADLHQSALDTIARLQSKLDLMANDPGAQYFMGIAEGQRIARGLGQLVVKDSPELASLRDQVARLQAELIAKDDAWIADQTANAAEIIRLGDKLERLQARLDAGPSVDQLAEWIDWPKGWHELRTLMIKASDRMEAANGK